MGFLDLLVVASMPPLQVLLIACLGAFLATEYCGILTLDTFKSLNQIVFYVFTPALTFASLASTLTLEEIVSWWFMPVNIAITFFVGSVLGWIVVKILRLDPDLEGLVIASCSAGNVGVLMLVIIPAICNEDTGMFGQTGVCKDRALSYASFSMAFGIAYNWTYIYSIMRGSIVSRNDRSTVEDHGSKVPNRDLDATCSTPILKSGDGETKDSTSDQIIVQFPSCEDQTDTLEKNKGYGVVKELLSPPTCSALLGLVVGALPWLKSLIIGSNAPLRALEDSIKLIGDGTTPSVTLILGANLTKGLGKAKMRKSVVIAVIIVRFVILPLVGILVVRGSAKLDFLPLDPLFRYTLLIQHSVPPAVNIGTMVELFDAGQEECSVIFLWTYAVAAFALTGWSMIYLWILANAW